MKKTKTVARFFTVNGLKQSPKDLDFHITPVLTFGRTQADDQIKAWSIAIEWGHWAAGLAFGTVES